MQAGETFLGDYKEGKCFANYSVVCECRRLLLFPYTKSTRFIFIFPPSSRFSYFRVYHSLSFFLFFPSVSFFSIFSSFSIFFLLLLLHLPSPPPCSSLIRAKTDSRVPRSHADGGWESSGRLTSRKHPLGVALRAVNRASGLFMRFTRKQTLSCL